jgi:hypothetical protein
VITTPVPVDDLYSRSNCYSDQDTLVFELSTRSSPLCRRLLARGGLLLAVCGVSETGSEYIPACLVKSWGHTGMGGYHEKDVVARSCSKDESVLGRPPANRIDRFITAQLDGPNLTASEQLPDSHRSVISATCDYQAGLCLISSFPTKWALANSRGQSQHCVLGLHAHGILSAQR